MTRAAGRSHRSVTKVFDMREFPSLAGLVAAF